MRFQALSATSMKMTVFGDVAPCRPVEIYERFGDFSCFHHEGYKKHNEEVSIKVVLLQIWCKFIVGLHSVHRTAIRVHSCSLLCSFEPSARPDFFKLCGLLSATCGVHSKRKYLW